MEITEIETLLADKLLFVRVHTDEGIVGVGESGTWAYLETSAAAVETFAEYLVGKDPRRIEHHWQYMYRRFHFRGAALMGALSAIDLALWDIKGKYHGVPAYELLGGSCRGKARVYATVKGDTTEKLLDRCTAAADAGFTAVGHLSPFLDESRDEPYFESHVEMIRTASDRVRQFRETVGDDVDLCIEIHRRLDPHEAVTLAREIEQYHPMFYEDPVRPDNIDAMAKVARKTELPIATGERLHTIHEFEMLLDRDAADYVRPDICMVGGLSQAKKIAGIAEANYVGVVPHNPLGPISTAACLQLAACIPNFAIQEFPYRPERDAAPGEDLVVDPPTHRDGFIEIPDEPGLGVELDIDEVADRPFEGREFKTRLHEDGSVIDQ
ncbi:galactonate dehydratase [Halosimplex pelagicum]|uniref:Galactonate dehydratase n=1 Tax=Halosimplex pelagicum TaxID=869886 RepID=A0A7D5TBF4_9EURY|nr:galactonate dehydratase [Halosimplex pelagicum]QLH82029.1 galactonate dehydratase [Halosimplex pelagicum]